MFNPVIHHFKGGFVRRLLLIAFPIALIGIPVTAFAALVLKLPLEWIYAMLMLMLMLMLEELVNCVGSTIRVKTRVWMNNLVAGTH